MSDDGARDDEAGPQYGTAREMLAEQMLWEGRFCRDQAWILSDFDTWERNPHYNGPPNPRHPEEDNRCGND